MHTGINENFHNDINKKLPNLAKIANVNVNLRLFSFTNIMHYETSGRVSESFCSECSITATLLQRICQIHCIMPQPRNSIPTVFPAYQKAFPQQSFLHQLVGIFKKSIDCSILVYYLDLIPVCMETTFKTVLMSWPTDIPNGDSLLVSHVCDIRTISYC